MPHVTIRLGTVEPLEPALLKAAPAGLPATEAIVHLGALELRGPAAALRALADACAEAASMAEEYDQDPEGYDQREGTRPPPE
jgi:hypothetical protein